MKLFFIFLISIVVRLNFRLLKNDSNKQQSPEIKTEEKKDLINDYELIENEEDGESEEDFKKKLKELMKEYNEISEDKIVIDEINESTVGLNKDLKGKATQKKQKIENKSHYFEPHSITQKHQGIHKPANLKHSSNK